MTKLLLVHWHYFTHELIEFEELNFLTGKNASGKSTIIDGMQLILLGDTSGSFFNKAASNRGSRTLKGYLLCELGDDPDSGFRYLRSGRFTSYIALEFFDQEKARYFTAGCCFDVFSENDFQRLFFLYDGEMHPQGFLNGGTPIDIPGLRAFLRECYGGHYETTDIGREFRTKLYGRLGGLRDRFAGLLKKAVSFNPNVDIQQFISDFVCDNQQTVDVSHMQENIRSYKNLEYESLVLQERISLLERIVKTYGSYTDAQNSEVLYSFLIDRAVADVKSEALRAAESEGLEFASRLKELCLRINEIDKRLTELREQMDVLKAELLSNGEAQALEQIDRQIASKEQEIQFLRSECDRGKALIASRLGLWRRCTEAMLHKIGHANHALLQAGISSRTCDIAAESRTFLENLSLYGKIEADGITQLGEAGLAGLSGSAEGIKTHSIELSSRLRDEQSALAGRRAELANELQSLEKGVYRFPQDAIDLKDAVASRLRAVAKRDVAVRIVAEAAEIKSDRWRNVIEGYLHTQKFYVVVPPEFIKPALAVFDAIKRQKAIYGTGIVDVERLRKLNPAADAGSLAEEIETKDPDVRLFLDFALGRVQKCDSVQELRKHRTSVTDEGMVYRNFVIRAINPDRWAKPAIGQGAILRRLDAVKREISLLTEQFAICASLKAGLDEASKMIVLNPAEIENAVSCAMGLAAIPDLEADLSSLHKNREAINTVVIDDLKSRIAALGSDIAAQDGLSRKETSEKGRLGEQLRMLREVTIPKLAAEERELESDIVCTYDGEWVESAGMPRYAKELQGRGKASNIAEAFPREQSRARNAKESAWEALVESRRSYNDRYKMGLDVKSAENSVYADTLTELCSNQLPEYQAKISDAKAKALEQFQEDFISRLQNNINSARRQIDELNAALRGASFGEDTYRFRILPKQDYKRYYDMIVDEMITQGGYHLLSVQFNDKYKDEIAELFAIITSEDGASGGGVEYERRIHEFTDFRTYLSFDLEVVGPGGESQRLSKTIGKKSGGETQTPFYIAVLASFAQLYRAGTDRAFSTLRLIIFDEAFSKMDSERIVMSIELLRKFRFQVILSAPHDKIGDIATLVDRNLCVLREGKLACVRSFDPRHMEELADE
ncbi:MAG: AAA family ATPase [Clostridiales bacterium]|nr:AAA family ATPase [Clostridiales bacterium]